MRKIKSFENEMDMVFESLKSTNGGEDFIKKFYKYPLGFLVLGNQNKADIVYNRLMHETPNESVRDFNIYYDCWLYLYTKLSNSKNSNIHYQKIIKNKSYFGGFSALPKAEPELRATAISSLCSFFENDIDTFKNGLNYICLIYSLNNSYNNSKFYFMLDRNKNIIKDFPVEKERKYVFQTEHARPLLYTFPLSILTLLCGYLFFNDRKYLYFSKKYLDIILKNDLYNDYCGKNIIAISLIYFLAKNKKYLKIIDNLNNYILNVEYDNGIYTHNNKELSVDRLSEYAIGLEFYSSIKNGKLPNIFTDFLNLLIK